MFSVSIYLLFITCYLLLITFTCLLFIACTIGGYYPQNVAQIKCLTGFIVKMTIIICVDLVKKTVDYFG